MFFARKKVLVVVFFLNVSQLIAQIPNFLWVKQLTTNSFVTSYGTHCDHCGNIYTTGMYRGTVDFDPGPAIFNLTSAGSGDGFLLKLDANGNFLFAFSIGGNNPMTTTTASQEELGFSICTDKLNNIYLSGTFGSVTDFDPGPGIYTLSPNQNTLEETFISKYNSLGQLLWARAIHLSNAFLNLSSFTGSPFNKPMVIDTNNNVYLAAHFTGIADLDPGASVYTVSATQTSNDVYLLSLNSNGNFIWGKNIGAQGVESVYSMDLDDSQNLIVCGVFENTVDFDPGPAFYNLSSQGVRDAFVFKISSTGNFIWAKSVGSSNTEHATSVTHDPLNYIYLTGGAFNSIDADPGPGTYLLPASGSYYSFVLKLNPAGNFVWGKQIASSAVSRPTYNSAENFEVFTTGNFNGTVDLDPGPGTAVFTSSTTIPYIVRLDSAGNYIWGYTIGNGPILFNKTGAVILSGGFSNTLDFDPGPGTATMTAQGNVDGYVCKLGICNDIAIPTCQSIHCSSSQLTVSVSSSTSLTWYSSLNSSVSISSGSTYITPTLSPGSYTYYVASASCNALGYRTPVVINVFAPPVLTLSATQSTICAGNKFTVTVTGAQSYSWSTGNSGSTFTLQGSNSGTYQVTGTDNTSNCKTTESLSIVVSPCTSVEEYDLEEINVFPNPATEVVYILTANKVHCVLYNQLLQKVAEGSSGSQGQVINVSSLPNGVYFLEISSDSKTLNQKLIISR